MALTPDDISEEYIASSRALAVTGTHLSHANTRAAVLKALEYARRHGLRTALDIDYRPVLWGLTSLGDGETRFIESGPVTSQLQEVLHLFDLVVGTEEEFHIAGGSTDTLTALKNVRNATKATLVCKRGPMGCVVLEGDIPDSWDQVPLQQGVRVEVLNVLGAGDAFMSGLLRGWLNDEGWEQACRYANACGALVVSRHGCAPAMPTKVELDDYLQRAESVPRPDVDERLNHLHRVTSRRQQWPELCIFAFDHRNSCRSGAGDRARRSLHSAAQAAVVGRGRSGGAGGRSRSAQRHSGRRHLRPACAQRHYRQGLVDRAPYRTAQLATTASGAWQHRLAADRLAAGACRQMPGLLSPGRPGGAACRAGRPAARGLAGL
ncbi:5-keto-2-deoxygluconokinase [Klebsiella pneumoniae]|uniref:5-keto-2-deoxygluconokinase n=1 Tax=Klebsiella pneumoniae TaxID=573 RepID=A0A377WE90_KLEPN|nr:5-keto-2-deoxygluconokinase [Klebsiella pneumoniae]